MSEKLQGVCMQFVMSFMLYSMSLSALAMVELDQAQLTGSVQSQAVHSTRTVGQTVTVGQAGRLDSVEVSLSSSLNPGVLTLEVLDFSGDDPALAPVLGLVEISADDLGPSLASLEANNITTTLIDLYPLNIQVSPGDVIALRFSSEAVLPSTFSVRVALDSDSYLPGYFFINDQAIPQNGLEAAFKLFVDTSDIQLLQLLNDEFDNTDTFAANWQNLNDVEGWGVEHLELADIDTTELDSLVMMPHTSSWFGNWKGNLLFKTVGQDFVLTTEVTATNRAQTDIPGPQYSLAGVMLRSPRSYPNGALVDWVAGGENYVFLSAGFAATNHPTCPGCPGPHFEVKNTTNSNSDLEVSSIATADNVQIRVARIGSAVLVLYRLPGDGWVVHRRFDRPDFPAGLQVGFVTYTDWQKVNTYTPFFHNSHLLTNDLSPDPSSQPGQPFGPELLAEFEFYRFDAVNLPVELEGVDLVSEASDMELLAFLDYDTVPYCPEALHVGDAIENGQITHLSAQNTITADNAMATGADVRYAAGDSIALQTGLRVATGAQLQIAINACAPL